MAATPHAERRAERVPINSARRRESSSSGFVASIPRVSRKRAWVSVRFSKASLFMCKHCACKL